MNYDLDDPLGDLLSDGSNDSFFEKPKKSGVEVNKSKPVTPNVSKSKMADLFDLKQEKPVSFDKKEVPKLVRTDSSSFVVKKDVVIPKKEEKPRTPQKLNDDSLISDLGFDPKKPKGKFNFMDDILGLGPVIKTTEIAKVQPPPRIKPTPKEDLLVPQNSLSRQSTTETVESFAPSVTRRSGRRNSLTPLNDPLGLFSTPVVEEKKEAEKKPIKRSEDLIKRNDQTEPPKSFIEDDNKNSQNYSQIISSYNLETESALSNLKQQENQLIIARQMKSQEQALFEMQKKQQILINQQEIQFNDLLQKQLHRQNLLENNIKSQQERINGFIQILMAQPSGISEEIVKSDNFTSLEAKSSNEIQDINLENEVKKLELEKLRLEDLISNVNSNHEKEMVLLEQSYKKQILIIEENLQKTEALLKSENKKLEDYYLNKMDLLVSEKQEIIIEHDRKIKELQDFYEKVITKMKESHEEQMETIKSDHKNMIENIREWKLHEFSIIQDSSSYLQTLQTASNYLENASGNIQHLKDGLKDKIDSVHSLRTVQLETREKKLEEQSKELERTKELTEIERTRLLELVKTLETKINMISQTSSEEQWNLRQKLASLEAERNSFEREREYAREIQTREEKRIENSKITHIEECQMRKRQLDEEKILIMEEKAKLETMSKINNTKLEVSTSRTEIDAAVKIAQDAIRQSDLERERLLDMQRKTEILKRSLVDQENSLRAKDGDLELAISSANAKEKSAETSIRMAKQLEHKVLIKLQMIQKHSRELSQKEANLSEERLEISRERLEIQALRKKLYQSRCSLCKIDDRSKEISDILTKNDDSENPKLDLNQMDFNQIDQYLDNEVANSMNQMNLISGDFEVNLENIPNMTEFDLMDTEMFLAQRGIHLN